MRRKSVYIGILAFAGCSAETLEDYMRFAFYLGRRCPEYDFYVSVLSKKEQFRGRNLLVEAAISVGASYLLMLDDDQILDITGSSRPSDQYGFIQRHIAFIESKPDTGIVGSLYWQRDGSGRPVVMRKGQDGKFYWIKREELQGKIEPVDVTGGGCIVINMKIFDRVPSPWFEPELEMGTDLQICTKAKDAGFSVYCDTGFEVGHVKDTREIITSKNAGAIEQQTIRVTDRMADDWAMVGMMNLYNSDVEEYLSMGMKEIVGLAEQYEASISKPIHEYDDPKDYYAALGPQQIARQVVFHNAIGYGTDKMFITALNLTNGHYHRILDYGCGTSPIGFELARYGHHCDFVDVDGAPAYEFVKWRARRRELPSYGFTVNGPYDIVLFLDSIEHIKDWPGVLSKVIDNLADGGHIVTNYFINHDEMNPEHMSMDKQAVKDFLVANKVYPVNPLVWRKNV